MHEIIFIIGLPGSGKSTLGIKLLSQKGPNSLFIDDVSCVCEDAEQYFKGDQFKQINTLLLADINFCEGAVLEKAVKLLTSIFSPDTVSFIYFENDPTQCLENVKHRQLLGDLRQVSQCIKNLTKIYRIPAGHHALTVLY